MACHSCKLEGLTCDGLRPCSYCQYNNVTCVYKPKLGYGQQVLARIDQLELTVRDFVQEKELQDLRERIRELEQRMKELEQSNPGL